MTTTRDTRPARFRFSLSHLFGATTLAAIALAATFGPRWDADERWIIGSWFLGALGMAAIGRARGQRGLVNAMLGGGLVPGAVAVAIPILGGGGGGPPERVIIVAAIVTLVGSAFGGLAVVLGETVAGVWQSGLLNSLREFFARWRPPPAWTGAPIGCVLAMAWLISGGTWRERVTIEFYGNQAAAPNAPAILVKGYSDSNPPDPVPDIALTSGGTLLAACGREPRDNGRVVSGLVLGGPDNYRLDLWETTRPWPRHVGTREIDGVPVSADFSPDGQLLAVCHRRGVAIWNTLTGEQTQFLDAPGAVANPPTVRTLLAARFTADGAALTARGWDVNRQSLFTWDAKSWELIRQQAFPGLGSLHVDHAGSRFARVILPPGGAHDAALELTDAKSLKVIRRFDHLGTPARPRFSPDDKLLAFGHRLWNLDSSREILLPGMVEDFANGGRRAVVLRRNLVSPGSSGLPIWLVSLPIVRHWFPAGQQTRLMLFDVRSGRLIRSSRDLGDVQAVTVSRNGRVVATATRKGQIRIWDVPEGVGSDGRGGT